MKIDSSISHQKSCDSASPISSSSKSVKTTLLAAQSFKETAAQQTSFKLKEKFFKPKGLHPLAKMIYTILIGQKEAEKLEQATKKLKECQAEIYQLENGPSGIKELDSINQQLNELKEQVQALSNAHPKLCRSLLESYQSTFNEMEKVNESQRPYQEAYEKLQRIFSLKEEVEQLTQKKVLTTQEKNTLSELLQEVATITITEENRKAIKEKHNNSSLMLQAPQKVLEELKKL